MVRSPEFDISISSWGKVLFKRKPVTYVPMPPILEDQEVDFRSLHVIELYLIAVKIWVIEETGEIFTNYNDYLAR